jgi:hypothetical protein
MPRPQRVSLVSFEQVRHGAGEEFRVGAADADPFDVDDNLARAWGRRLDVFDAGVVRTVDDECAHDDIMAA